jgi:hypothetical protein
MEPFLQEPDYTYDSDYLLTFYTGEALVALLEYFEKIKDEKLLEIIKKSQEYYIKKYVIELDSNYYPAYVPWHSISLNKLYKITKDIKYAKATFTLNDKLLDLLDRTEHVGRFFNLATPQYGAPHASSDGVYTEGLVYAYELAFLVKDKERIAKYKEALELAFNHILSLQFTSENSKGFPEPERAIGAFRIYRTSPSAPFTERPGANVRIDTVQHILDAFRKYELVQKLVS